MSLLCRVSNAINTAANSSMRHLRTNFSKAGLGALSCLMGITCLTAHAQDGPSQVDYTVPQEGYAIPDYSGSLNAQPNSRPVGGFGTKGRIGHDAGNTVGRRGSLTYFDLSPYMYLNNGVIFGDGRIFVKNDGRMGGSAGLGGRHFFPAVNSVVGATFYYDRDDSRSVTFEQFAIAGEILTELLDIRANYYIPIGTEQQITSVRFEPGSQEFIGNNIQFRTRTASSSILEGLDLTFTTPLHGEFAERFNLEASAGWYHYEPSGQGLESINGWKLRLDGDLAEQVSHAYVEFTSDDAFDQNVVLGIDVNYWDGLQRGPRIGKSQYHRLADWVRRTRTVSTLDDSAVGDPIIARDPETGLPYFVVHVRNVPTDPPVGIGDGTLENPYQYIQTGVDDLAADIVFVHANSIFDGDVDGNANAMVALREDVLVLGEGVQLTLPVAGLNQPIVLPTATDPTGPFDRPILRDVDASMNPVVTLADDSRFAGFEILNVANGFAISGIGINGAEVNEVIIDIDPLDPLNPGNPNAPQGSGIQFVDSTGLIQLENISIANTAGNAFEVLGGNANIVFNGASTIDNTSGFSVLINDAAGAVNLSNVTITENGGEGVEVSGTGPGDSTANVTFETVSLTNTNSPDGIFRIFNHGGAVSVLGSVLVDGGTGPGILIDELQSSGAVTFQGQTRITNRNQEGIIISNIQEGTDPLDPSQSIAGIVQFQGPVTIQQGTGAGVGAAIDMQSSIGTVVFNTIQIDGGVGNGINLANLTDIGTTAGQFIVSGMTQISNISGVSFNIDNIDKPNFTVTTNGIFINNRGDIGINVSNSASLSRFFGTNVVDNQLLASATGVNIVSNTGSTSFNDLTVANAFDIGAGPIPFGVRVFDNFNSSDTDIAQVTFTSLNVDSVFATAVSIVENERVTVASGTIEALDARAIEVIGFDPVGSTDVQEHSLTFSSIDATNTTTVDFGILVQNSQGGFSVTGTGTAPGSGGLIEGMTVAGARFENTQFVGLANMDFDANNRGVDASELIVSRAGFDPGLLLNNVNITDSASNGIRAVNVSDFLLMNSFLSNNGIVLNGLQPRQQILFSAQRRTADIDGDGTVDDPDDDVTYNVAIVGSTVSDPIGTPNQFDDMILIESTGAGNGAPLNFDLLRNGIPGLTQPADMLAPNRPFNAGVHVNWTGDSSIVMDQNTILMGPGGALQTGVQIDVDGIADVVFTRNSLSSSGIGDVGLQMGITDQADVVISNNLVLDADNLIVGGSGFQMTGIDATAIDLTLQGSNNNLFIESNLINLTGVDSAGIIVQRIFGPSNVTINGNSIFLVTDFDTLLEEGIVFRDVRGTINLFGTVNNEIPIGTFFPFFVDFSIPNGASTGSIIVNGSPRP